MAKKLYSYADGVPVILVAVLCSRLLYAAAAEWTCETWALFVLFRLLVLCLICGNIPGKALHLPLMPSFKPSLATLDITLCLLYIILLLKFCKSLHLLLHRWKVSLVTMVQLLRCCVQTASMNTARHITLLIILWLLRVCNWVSRIALWLDFLHYHMWIVVWNWS